MNPRLWVHVEGALGVPGSPVPGGTIPPSLGFNASFNPKAISH